MKDYTSKPQKKVSRTNINEHKDSQTGTQVAMKLSRPSAKHNNNRITVQPKLELTQPGDQYEQEADRMADFIMRKQFDNAAMPSTTSVLPPVISRKTDTGSGVAIDTATEHGINASRGGGHTLPDSLRSQMESGFGTDFSKVRLHTDSQAAQLSQNINAKAFTYGNDIYFNKGQYNPTSNSGQHLIVHELTHVVQQSGKVGRQEGQEEDSVNSIQYSSTFTQCNTMLNTIFIRLKGAIHKCTQDDYCKIILNKNPIDELNLLLNLFNVNGFSSVVANIAKDIYNETKKQPVSKLYDDIFEFHSKFTNKIRHVHSEEELKHIYNDLLKIYNINFEKWMKYYILSGKTITTYHLYSPHDYFENRTSFRLAIVRQNTLLIEETIQEVNFRTINIEYDIIDVIPDKTAKFIFKDGLIPIPEKAKKIDKSFEFARKKGGNLNTSYPIFTFREMLTPQNISRDQFSKGYELVKKETLLNETQFSKFEELLSFVAHSFVGCYKMLHPIKIKIKKKRKRDLYPFEAYTHISKKIPDLNKKIKNYQDYIKSEITAEQKNRIENTLSYYGLNNLKVITQHNIHEVMSSSQYNILKKMLMKIIKIDEPIHISVNTP